jgi:hypothetical protein
MKTTKCMMKKKRTIGSQKLNLAKGKKKGDKRWGEAL